MTNLSKDEIEAVVRDTVRETLFSLGLDAADNKAVEEVRKDMAHLRKWRKSVDQVQSTTFMVALGIVVTGVMGAIWLGIKAMLGQ